jgi:hypothetical protein
MFFEAFLNGKFLYSPFLEHVLEYWKLKDEENLLFIFYEDMKSDLRSVIKKTMKFFEREFSSDEIEKLCNYLSFDSMKTNSSCNKQSYVDFCKKTIESSTKHEKFNFIRNGKVGSFSSEFTSEIDKKFDEIILNNPAAIQHQLFFKTRE